MLRTVIKLDCFDASLMIYSVTVIAICHVKHNPKYLDSLLK